MRRNIFLRKAGLLGTISLIVLSTLSYACGMGAKSPSDHEGGPAPSAEQEK